MPNLTHLSSIDLIVIYTLVIQLKVRVGPPVRKLDEEADEIR